MLREKRRSHTASIVVLSLLCAALIVAGVFLFLRGHRPDETLLARYQVEGLDPAAQIGALPGSPRVEQSPGENMFTYRINTSPTFQSDGTEGDLMVENPSHNQYLMVVELVADGDETTLYRSQYIAPNQYIEHVSLDHALSPGEHEGTAYLNAVDPETLELVGILECPLLIEVKG